MKKNVWILNHYATDTFLDQGGRHYWFAKYLKKEGYSPVIFCANTVHGFDMEIDTHGRAYIGKKDKKEGIPYVFLKTPRYTGNGMSRIKNMAAFYRLLPRAAKSYAKRYGEPDVIFASSVHPLTLIAGIKIAKKMGIKCICEIRDLWPESIVAYGKLKRESLLAKILYLGEKWIYKKADALIFTMEGGKAYIRDRKWDKGNGGPIDLKKVHYINNGIDLPELLKQREKKIYVNEKFDHIKGKKIIYTGSIREVNGIDKLLDTAKLLKEEEVTFCIFGDGEEREKLEQRLVKEKIDNVIFFGKADKKYVPDIVSRAWLLIVQSQDKPELTKYGLSANKIFDYLASGKAIISTLSNPYSIINKYDCGVEQEMTTADVLAKHIKDMISDDANMEQWGKNAAIAAKRFSFEQHTNKLIAIIEKL